MLLLLLLLLLLLRRISRRRLQRLTLVLLRGRLLSVRRHALLARHREVDRGALSCVGGNQPSSFRLAFREQ